MRRYLNKPILNERGVTLRTTVIISVAALVVVGAGLFVYYALSGSSSGISLDEVTDNAVPVVQGRKSGGSGSNLLSLGKIDAAPGYTCTVLIGGSLRCWGANSAGRLGDGTGDDDNTPVPVIGIDGSTPSKRAIQVSTGSLHACAVLVNGSIKCWGYNGNGRLGNDTSDDSRIPVLPIGIDGSTSEKSATQVSAGQHHTCALLVDGAVNCWGRNYFGQVGNGTAGVLYNVDKPSPVTGIDGSTSEKSAIQISAGRSHTCALLVSGGIRCWGYNENGQLGDGTTDNANTPSPVVGIDESTSEKSAIQISAGGSQTCALLVSGGIRCWGYNENGQLGDGATDNTNTPSPVIGIDGSTPSKRAVSISAGLNHACAVLVNGSIKCWGHNSFGQLGNGRSGRSRSDDSADSYTPSPVVGIDGLTFEKSAIEVSVGLYHTCVLLMSGHIRCWGHNDTGQLGNGNNGPNSNFDTPVLVIGIGD